MLKVVIAVGFGIVGIAAVASGASTFQNAPARTPGPVLDRPALLIIDIQNFYFDGGRVPLVGSVKASLKARILLDLFRSKKLPVIHVRHMPKVDPGTNDPQYEIHPNVAPQPGETVVIKVYANPFRETDLQGRLQALGIKSLVICGMQTHMCVEAATRHAADLEYNVVLAGDACATRDLSFGGVTVPAASVHAAVLAAMNGTYAKVVSVVEIGGILK